MRPLTSLPPTLLALLTLTLPASATDDLQIDTTNSVTCSRPTRPGDKLSVHYRGTLQSDGTEFDASYNRGQPFTFTLGAGQVIKGWDEGLKDMCPSEERRLTVPSGMAYGAFGSPPVIPGGATLIFETLLVEIVGVDAGVVSSEGEAATSGSATEGEAGFTIATAPSEPTAAGLAHGADKVDATPTLEATPLRASATGSPTDSPEGECHLLGPFALIVQAALGITALLSLVYKRWRETPKRPWKIWFFDVSKQVVGSMLLHVLNLLMSMIGAGDIEHASQTAVSKNTGDAQAGAESTATDGGRSTPNPCSFYLLNLLIDTTIGIGMLYLLLKIVHVAFSYTPLARPKESIKSGHYGQPPHVTWWLKQSLLYFIGLVGMKLCVLLLFLLLPWLPWVGDWMLRWTEGNEALEIAFVMFIFPLAMNAVQYWIIDNFIMDKQGREGKGGAQGDEAGEYERVHERGYDGESDDDGDDGATAVADECAVDKDGLEGERDQLVGGEGSRKASPLGPRRKERDD